MNIAFDSENGSNFAWNSGNTWLIGILRDGGVIYHGVDGGTIGGLTSTSLAYPFLIRILKDSNDAIVCCSSDNGVSWYEGGTSSSGVTNPGKGILSGVSNTYIRAVFASPVANQQIKVDWVKQVGSSFNAMRNGGLIW